MAPFNSAAYTPYPAYKQYILKRYPSYSPDPYYTFSDESSNSIQRMILDLSTFKVVNSFRPLKSIGSIIHRTSLCLFSDLYKPISVSNLFSKLYHNEFYESEASSLKVRQCVFRLQKCFEENNIDIKFGWKNGYFIDSLGSFSIGYSPDLDIGNQKLLENENPILKKLYKKFNNSEFSASDLSVFIEKSHSSAVRIINKLKEAGFVTSSGRGYYKVYKIVKL